MPYFSFGFYLRHLVVENKYYTLNKKNRESIDAKDIRNYFIKNNEYMLNNCFKYFLQKLLLVKFTTKHKNIKEEKLNDFNKYSIEKLLSLIGLEDLYNALISKNKNKNKINFVDIFEVSSKLYNKNNAFYKEYGTMFDYKKTFEFIINNIKKKKIDKYIINKKLIVQFTPLKFDLIHLDENIFDVVEKYLDEKCSICQKIPKHYYICLICGSKICDSEDYHEHLEKCNIIYCIYLDIKNFNIFLYSELSEYGKNVLYPLYVNEAGVGPMQREIGNEFNLSKEKYKLTLRNFICNNFNIN